MYTSSRAQQVDHLCCVKEACVVKEQSPQPWDWPLPPRMGSPASVAEGFSDDSLFQVWSGSLPYKRSSKALEGLAVIMGSSAACLTVRKALHITFYFCPNKRDRSWFDRRQCTPHWMALEICRRCHPIQVTGSSSGGRRLYATVVECCW